MKLQEREFRAMVMRLLDDRRVLATYPEHFNAIRMQFDDQIKNGTNLIEINESIARFTNDLNNEIRRLVNYYENNSDLVLDTIVKLSDLRYSKSAVKKMRNIPNDEIDDTARSVHNQISKRVEEVRAHFQEFTAKANKVFGWLDRDNTSATNSPLIPDQNHECKTSKVLNPRSFDDSRKHFELAIGSIYMLKRDFPKLSSSYTKHTFDDLKQVSDCLSSTKRIL